MLIFFLLKNFLFITYQWRISTKNNYYMLSADKNVYADIYMGIR